MAIAGRRPRTPSALIGRRHASVSRCLHLGRSRCAGLGKALRGTVGRAGTATQTREEPMSDLQAVADRRPILPIRMPGRAARAVREGANLAPEHAVGKRTWEEFLAERVPA